MKNNRGFTIIELLIVLGLIGIVLSMIFSPIIFSFKNFRVQNEKTNIIFNARTAMDYLTRQIRKANEVEVVDGNIIKIDSDVYKLKDRSLAKNDKIVIEGIDKLTINKVYDEIKIEIVIKDSRSKGYSLSSTINMR